MPRAFAVCVVEDDAPLREGIGSYLRSFDLSVELYGSAEAFLREGAAGRAACVVTDIQLPGISGVELATSLSAIGCRAPIIIMTARTDAVTEAAALAVSPAGLLRKPFAMSDLYRQIETLLQPG